MAYIKFNKWTTHLGEDVNLSSDTLGVVLTNTEPVAADEVLGDITQIANGNGYTTDGPNVAITSWGDSDVAGVAELVNASPTFTANGGSMGPFQWAVLYDKTTTIKYLIGATDYGSAKTLADGESVAVNFDDGTNTGTFTVGP